MKFASLSSVLSAQALMIGASLLAQGPPPSQMHAFAMQQQMQMQMQMQMRMQQSLQAARRANLEALRRAQNLRSGAGAESTDVPLAAPKAETWRVATSEYRPFVATKDRVVAMIPWNGGSGSTLIRAFQRQTGKDVWQFVLKASVECGPAQGKDLVLLGTNDYKVIAYDLQTGEERWKASLDVLKRFIMDNSVRPLVYFTVEGDRVFVGTYGKGADGEASGKLYALNLATGEKLWERPLARGAVHPPVVAGDVILVGGGPWLQAFRNLPGASEDGQELWKQPTEASLDLGIGVAWEGRYAYRTPDLPRVVDLKDGRLIWKGSDGAAAFADGTRLVWAESAKRGVTFHAQASGSDKRQWERTVPVANGPWIQDGLAVYLGKNEVAALKTETGEDAWHFPLAGAAQAPFWVEGRILVWKKDGGKSLLHALDPKNGQPAWTYTVACKPGMGMIHADAYGIIFPGQDGTLVCLQ